MPSQHADRDQLESHFISDMSPPDSCLLGNFWYVRFTNSFFFFFYFFEVKHKNKSIHFKVVARLLLNMQNLIQD